MSGRQTPSGRHTPASEHEFARLRGATQYPIWRSSTMVEDDMPLATSHDTSPGAADRVEEMPASASPADRALAAVADIAQIVMPSDSSAPAVQLSCSYVAQFHFEQSILKLSTAIKNIADGMHSLERRQNDADAMVQGMREDVRSVEDRTISLKTDQLAVLAAAKKALHTSKQQSDYLEIEKCAGTVGRPAKTLDPAIEERLADVEQKVAALLQWQEDEAAKGIEQIMGRPAQPQQPPQSQRPAPTQRQDRVTEELKNTIKTNCTLLRSLQASVASMEDRTSAKVSEDIVSEMQQLRRHIQQNCVTRDQLTPVLKDLEAKANLGLLEARRDKASTAAAGGESVTTLATTGGAQLKGVEARLERSEARFDKNIIDLQDRLDPIQDFVNQQRLAGWQTSRHMPEIGQKLDQLWAQCQYYFSKVKEHDVHFTFFRNSFESHKQHLLDFSDLDRPNGSRRKGTEDNGSSAASAAGSHTDKAATLEAPSSWGR